MPIKHIINLVFNLVQLYMHKCTHKNIPCTAITRNKPLCLMSYVLLYLYTIHCAICAYACILIYAVMHQKNYITVVSWRWIIALRWDYKILCAFSFIASSFVCIRYSFFLTSLLFLFPFRNCFSSKEKGTLETIRRRKSSGKSSQTIIIGSVCASAYDAEGTSGCVTVD